MRKDLNIGHWVVLAILAGGQAGCGGGGGGGSGAGVSAAASSADTQQAAQGLTATATAVPQISGNPPTEVAVGEAYVFQPTVSDSAEASTFSISNLPSWAQFDADTGRLSGTPSAADVGVYQGISIRVADMTGQSILASFSINVVQVGAGAATVSWVAPVKNTDGSVLQNLEGFLVHFGRSAEDLNRKVKINNASVSTYVIENLTAGTWYFAVSAFNSGNVESSLSSVRSKVID